MESLSELSDNKALVWRDILLRHADITNALSYLCSAPFLLFYWVCYAIH
jgi:hypothetical protein